MKSRHCINSEHGYPDNIQTYGLVSGLWTSTFALGAFIGPFISGLLYDYVGFRKGVIFIIATQLIVGGITVCFLCHDYKRVKRTPKLYKEMDPQEPLITNHKHSFDSYGGTDSINQTIVPEPIMIQPKIMDRKYYFNDSPHQTNTPILSIA